MVPPFKTSFYPFDIKEIKNLQSDSQIHFQYSKKAVEKTSVQMTRAKPHFHHEIKFSISNFQLLNCQRGKLAGE